MKLASAGARKKVEINLVPLLDSIFILIFFFMFALSTMVKKTGLSVSLPKSTAGKKLAESSTISVKLDGRLFWNEEPLAQNQIEERLRAFQKANPEGSLVIKGDKGTAFENIVRILDQAEKTQLKKVRIQTRSN